jgi:hypothetical protein
MKQFLLEHYSFVTHFIDIIAAIAGTIYIKKSRDKITRLFVYYLWVIVFVENVAMYSRFMLNNFDNEYFIWIKNSPICTNHWLYNFKSLLDIILLGLYFKTLVKLKPLVKVINFFVAGFIIFFILYFSFSSSFFYRGIDYGFMIKTIILTIFICMYYLSIIKSDKILEFYYSKHFYISSILLVWYLCITPLFIFSGYFRQINTNFIEFRAIILLSSNIIMYLCFTAIFFYSYYKTK